MPPTLFVLPIRSDLNAPQGPKTAIQKIRLESKETLSKDCGLEFMCQKTTNLKVLNHCLLAANL